MDSIYKEFLYGMASSTIATMIFHPFDTVRINQIKDGKSIFDTIRTLYRENFRFYRALPIGCIAYATTYGLYFSVSNTFKYYNFVDTQRPWLLYISSYVPATICAMTITNPLWAVKTAQISSTENLTMIQTARNIYREYGVRGFYRGLLFGYLNGSNGIIAFTLYDVLKDWMDAKTSTEFAICSAVSKTCACLITFPIFSIRIRQQLTPDRPLFKVLRSISSIRSAYCGIVVTLVQMVPRTTVMLVLYENIKRVCSDNF